MKNLNTVHLNGLRAVEAVGRLGSLQAAATELGVSVGAISQQVIKTEQQLGRLLFDRLPKGMVATEAGRDILRQLSDGFHILSGAVGAARRRDDNVLTVSVAPVFAARWLVYRLGSFAERHPNLRLRIDATSKLIDPTTSDVDLCIRVGKGDWPGVRTEHLLDQLIFPVCAPGLARSLKVPADLLRLPSIIDSQAMFHWDTWLAAVGLAGHPLAEGHAFSEASLCLDAAISGQGVMMAWQTLASHAIRAGQLCVPFGPWMKTGFSHYFVTADRTRPDPKVEAFKSWIRDELEDDMNLLEAAVRLRGDPPA